MSRFVSGGATYTYEGTLDEHTEVIVERPGRDPVSLPFGRIIAMTGGAVLEDAGDG